MTYYDKVQIERDTVQSGRMFVREFPKMFGYLLFFYAILGFGIPWRIELPREVMWNCTKASLMFGATQGGVMLVTGAVFMRAYALRKARYTDFGPAASLTMLWSFRVFGLLGVPLATWDVFRVVLPAAGRAGEQFAQDWWLWLLLAGAMAGWFSGKSIGGLVGLLAIWLSGRSILGRL